MSLIFDAIFASVAFSHLIVDILNGSRAVLLTYVATQLGMNNAQLGLATTIYILSAALVQPIFGLLSDRFGTRWVVAGGVVWMGIFYSMGLIVPGTTSLWLLVLASMGSGAFHPAGGMQATVRGRTIFQGRETAAASYFFVFGQLGYFFGPILAGPLLDHVGPAGMLVMVAPAFPMAIFAANHLPVIHRITGAVQSSQPSVKSSGQASPDAQPVSSNKKKNGSLSSTSLIALVSFGLLAASQSWAQQNITTFLPKYLSDLGQSASTYGLIAALFMGGTAIGNVVGGNLADRYGRRNIAMITLLLSALPFYLMPLSGTSAWLLLLVPISGLLIGSTQSIVVVHGQNLIPGGMALATGLILGFTFSSGAIGTYLSGLMADIWGFGPVFQFNSLLVIIAAVTSWVLSGKPQPAVEPTRQVETL